MWVAAMMVVGGAADRALREEVWHAYTDRCKEGEFDNTKIIDTLVYLISAMLIFVI